MKTLAKMIATTAGTGYFPIAPGTVGSAIAVVVLWFLQPVSPLILLGLFVLFYGIGVWASGETEKLYYKDPGLVNWDEFLGQWIALFALPHILWVYVAGFFLFRLFDIWKPVPVRTAERLPGGTGIMTDDVVAGVYANLVLQLVLFTVTYGH
ncbi:MAG: phosphatidylglycerophosphatase A [candidate division KSB1 bacterium]|nr:phosphatidylglycerophosphatase A [candidate division KSB1 bacterium]